MNLRVILLLSLLNGFITSHALEVGDNLCVQGFVMDKFCIDAVQMIDNGKDTLEKPFEHSVHCLIDLPICYNSDYEVLTDPTTEGGLYSRGYRLTPISKQSVVELARSAGSCSTCTNGYDSSKLEDGFRAVLNATILELATDGGAGPPLIMVNNQAYPDPSDTNPCQTVFNLQEGKVMSNNPNASGDDEKNTSLADSAARPSSSMVGGLLLALGSTLVDLFLL